MGPKNSKQDKLNSFMSQYDIIQQIQAENLTFLQHKRTSQQFLLREFSFNDRKQFDKTITNLDPLKSKLSGCKHVVPLKDYLTTSEDQYCSTFYKIYALFEYPQRTLDDEVSERNLQKRKFAETQLWSILASCILGLSHLQKNGIKHSALKSRNILLSKEGIIKVSDPFATGQHSNYQTALTKRSTPHLYLPPEQTNALQQELITPSLNTHKGDIWTMGIIMLEAGLLQYQDECYRDEWSRVHWQTLHYNINRFGQSYSEELKNMLQFMLSKEQKMRPDWIELEEHVMKNSEQNRNSLIQNQNPQVQSQNNYPPPSLNSKPQVTSGRTPIITDRYNSNSPSHANNLKTSKPTNKDIPLATGTTGIATNLSIPPTTTTNNPILLSPRNPSNRGSFNPSSGLGTALGTASHTVSPGIGRIGGGGLSFGSNLPVSSQQENNNLLTPILQSNIDLTRPLKNIFPKSSYSMSTKVDENLVMVDDGDEESNYLKEGNSRFNQPFNMMSSPEEQKYSQSLSQQSHTIQPNTQSFAPNFNQFNTRASENQNLYKNNNPYEPKYVVETFKLGSKYEGYKLNGMRHGHGKFYYQDGGMYDGDWYENKMQGNGKLYYQSGKLAYEGEWKSDQFTGKGVLYNEEPDQIFGNIDYKNFDDIGEYWIRYEGNFLDDMKNGKGVLHFSNGQKFDGQFLEDAVHGYGKFHKSNGEVVSGKWDNNLLVY